MAYEDLNELTRVTASDKILRDKAFNISKNPKYHVYQRGIASMVYKLFDKKDSGSEIKNYKMSNKELAGKVQKQLLEHSRKEKYIHLFQTIFGVLMLLICN